MELEEEADESPLYFGQDEQRSIPPGPALECEAEVEDCWCVDDERLPPRSIDASFRGICIAFEDECGSQSREPYPSIEGGGHIALSQDEIGPETERSAIVEDDPQAWVPGASAGSFFERGRPPCEQAQVLLANALATVRSMPLKLREPLSEFLTRDGKPRSIFENKNDATTARLLCVPTNLVRTADKMVKIDETTGLYAPSPTETRSDAAEVAQRSDADATEVLANLTSVALGVVADNSTSSSYVSKCARMVGARADVGDRYHSLEFYKEAVFLAARLVQAQDATAPTSNANLNGVANSFESGCG